MSAENRPLILVKDNSMDVDMTLRAFCLPPGVQSNPGRSGWPGGAGPDRQLADWIQFARRDLAGPEIAEGRWFEKFLDVAGQIDLYWMVLNNLPR